MEAFNRLGSTLGQTTCYWLLLQDNQLDTAEGAALRGLALLPRKGHESLLCKSHHILGNIYHRKGEKENAFNHFESAMTIASPFNWHNELYWAHYAMAALFSDEDNFNNANAHIEAAKSHTGNGVYKLGRVMGIQAVIWYRQSRPEDAKSKGLLALKIYEGLRSAKDVEGCRRLLRRIESDGKPGPRRFEFPVSFLTRVLLSIPADSVPFCVAYSILRSIKPCN